MTFARNITTSQAVSDVLRASGLAVPGTIAGSTDKTAIQMLQLLNDVGQRLLEEYDWQFLSREFTITTVPGTPNYALPVDFNKFFLDSSWNRTTRLPAIGSLQQYEWQMLKARALAGTTFTMLFRIQDDEVVFYDTPSTVQTIVMPYLCRAWIRKEDSTYADSTDVNGDTILYDPQLIKTALRLAWYEAKEFDTTKLVLVYNRALAAAKTADSPARTLSLSTKADYPYLGVINIPDTNYGGG